MSYLNESRLSTYDSNLKEWISSQESKTITSSIYPWTLTEKAGAVTCYSVGGTELKPVINFLFTETLPASGDKGPENPSTITGVSTVKVARCGKNLVQYPYENQSQTISDVVFTVNNDGTISANGIASAKIAFILYRYIAFKKGVSYRLSGCSGGSDSTYSINIDLRRNYSGSGYFNTIVDIGNGATYTPSVDCWGAIYVSIRSGVSLINQIFKPQLELGFTTTSFESYSGDNYTISLGSIYYGGSVDVASGVMTVTHFVGYIDSTASFGIFQRKTNTVAIVATLTSQTTIPKRGEAVAQNSSCDSFTCSSDTSDVEHMRITSYVDRQFRIYIAYTTLGVSNESTDEQIIAAASSWFTNHPATFVLGLTEPNWQFIQLSPVSISALTQTDKYTPRLNTIYSDQESVQVGYIKSPIHNEFELQQAIMAQGENI